MPRAAVVAGAHLRSMHRRRLLTAGFAAALGPAACAEPVLPVPPLRRSTGLDAQLTTALLTQAAALPRLHALLVARDGTTLVERAFRGPGLDRPANIKSASKSLLSAIAGAAIARGVLTGVDQRIAPILGARVPADVDPRVRELTVGHLLSMRTGLQSTSGPNFGAWAASADPVAYALGRSFVDQPGGRMIYSTGTSHVLSAVLTRASGRSTLELARDWLGGPLDVEVPAWPRDPQGTYIGGNDMRLSPRALLRFGEAYRLDGALEDERLVPAAWVRASWRPQGVSMWTGAGYGNGWWARSSGAHDVRYAWGYGGQMVFVVPSLALTAVMTSDPSPAERDGHVHALHALLDTLIVPAAERGAQSA